MSKTAPNNHQPEGALTWLEGTLVYDEKETVWRWCDGTEEPRVFTLRQELFAPDFMRAQSEGDIYVFVPGNWKTNYRTRLNEAMRDDIAQLVENSGVPLREHPELCANMKRQATASVDGWLVPIDDWDAIMGQPVGAAWEPEDQDDLLDIANKLTME